MDFIWGLGIGLGLAAIAGLRAFPPLVGMLSIVVFAGFGSPPWLFMQINNWLSLPVIGTLLALLILECVLDKFAALDPLLDRAMVPVRSISGAAVFALASVEWNLLDPMLGPMSSGHFVKLPAGLLLLAPYLMAGALVAGAVATLKAASIRQSAATRTFARSRILRSFLEDAAALLGTVAPLLAPVVVAFALKSRSWIRRPQHDDSRAPAR